MIRIYPCYWPVPKWLEKVEYQEPYRFYFASPITFIIKYKGMYRGWMPIVIDSIMIFKPKCDQFEKPIRIIGQGKGVCWYARFCLKI